MSTLLPNSCFLLHDIAFIFLCHAGHHHHKASNVNSPQFANKLCSKCVSKLDVYTLVCNDFSHRYSIKLITIQPSRVLLRSALAKTQYLQHHDHDNC